MKMSVQDGTLKFTCRPPWGAEEMRQVRQYGTTLENICTHTGKHMSMQQDFVHFFGTAGRAGGSVKLFSSVSQTCRKSVHFCLWHDWVLKSVCWCISDIKYGKCVASTTIQPRAQVAGVRDMCGNMTGQMLTLSLVAWLAGYRGGPVGGGGCAEAQDA
jgi:hypothetical protein